MEGLFSSLKGKRVFITGSSRGIGRALAEGFAQNGADVAVHGVGPNETTDKAIEDISRFGTKIVGIYGDLSDPQVPERLIADTVKALGGIDILICNASVQVRNEWNKVDYDEMQFQTQVNFYSTIKLIQTAVPYMLENGWGRVITIGSTQQEKPHPEMLIYSATKCAVRNVVQSVALRLADKNITVNNISVGVVHTDRNAEVLKDKEYYEIARNRNPMKIIGDPVDCVAPVLMLASEAGRYITGDNIHVDGGRHIS